MREALSDTRVVALVGPRQSGKTTLAKAVAEADGRAYFTLDDAQTRAFAADDPTGFLRGIDRAVIDEIQRVPELVLAIKQSVDADPRFGKYLITGSADLFGGSIAPDSLAGRVQTIELLPLSQAELLSKPPSRFLEGCWSGHISSAGPSDSELVERVLAGGYPEALTRKSDSRRSQWFTEYARALALRDVVEIAEVQKPDQMWNLLEHMALRNGQLLNASKLASFVGVDIKTIDRWIALFEKLFVVHRLKAWHSNLSKRLVRAPKLHFFDSGLVAALQGTDRAGIAENRLLFGPLLETFVFAELRKAAALSPAVISISHYRDKDQAEVDFVLERSPGHLVGVEVKSAASVGPVDFKGLIRLRDLAGEKFKYGVILHNGDRVMQFGDRLFAAPLSALWCE